MSEFSESYHLVGPTQEAVALLERAGLAGWAFPESNGWTMFVVEGPFTGEPIDEVVAANQGVLVHYVNAEDHGWWLRLFDGPTQVSSSAAVWDEDIELEVDDLDPDALRRLLGHVPPDRWDDIVRHLTEPPSEAMLISGRNPGHHVAELLGLDRADWMSGDYLANDPDAASEPGIVRVDP